MKLTTALSKDLIDVLNAQSGVAKIADKDEYKAKLAKVGEFLNTKDGKAVGGITKAVYDANKDNKALVDAAKVHLDKAKERAAKAKEAPAEKAPAAKKAAKAAPAKEAPASKGRTPEQEAATAKDYVAYVDAVTGKQTLPKAEFARVELATRKYRDPQKGGLKNTAPEGKDSPWKRFGSFEGVKDAAKAHQAHVKAKGKEAPTM